MKAIKGLLIYMGIALAIIAGIAVVLFAIMFFFPNFRPFGIGIINKNDEIKGQGVSLFEYKDYENFELNINSKDITIKVVPTVYEIKEDKEKKQEYIPPTFNYKLSYDVFGFTNELTEFNVVSDVAVVEDKVCMVVNVSQPKGLMSFENSCLYVYVPETINYNLIVNTEKADVILGAKDYKLTLNTMSIVTDSGDLYFNNMADVNNSMSINSLNISTKSGYMDFSSIETINVYGLTTLEATQGDFVFRNLISGSIDAKGTGIKIQASSVKTNSAGFKFFSESGIFLIKNLECSVGAENTIITENCNFNISNIIGSTVIVSTYGNIKIEQITGDLSIESSEGDVELNFVDGNLDVVTQLGDIKVISYTKSAIFKSEKGIINVANNSDYVHNQTTQITSGDGNVTVSNKVNKLMVTTYGNSVVEISIKSVQNGLLDGANFEHTIILNDNSMGKIFLPSDKPFRFKAIGKISGSIGGFYMKADDNYQYYPIDSTEVIDGSKTNCSFYFDGVIEFATHA